MPTFHFYFCHEPDPIFIIKAQNKFLAWGIIIERVKDYSCTSIAHMKKIGFRVRKVQKMYRYTEEELNSLTPEWRNALVDIDHYHLSYSVHAAKAGINIGTVKSRVHRARAKVKEMRAELAAKIEGEHKDRFLDKLQGLIDERTGQSGDTTDTKMDG